jgi:hypothetical protein
VGVGGGGNSVGVEVASEKSGGAPRGPLPQSVLCVFITVLLKCVFMCVFIAAGPVCVTSSCVRDSVCSKVSCLSV